MSYYGDLILIKLCQI